MLLSFCGTRSRVVALSAAFLVLVGSAGSPALASVPDQDGVRTHAQTLALCTLSARLTFTPGVYVHMPVSGTGTSHGQTGTAHCAGEVRGSRIIGTGSFGYSGSFEDITCLGDRVPLRGTYDMLVPTVDGPKTLHGRIVDARVGPLAVFTLTGDDHALRGPALVLNLQGDCYFQPVTEVGVTIVGTLTGA